MGLVWQVPLQASKKMGEREEREVKLNPRAPTGFLGLHSCWDATGCPSTELKNPELSSLKENEGTLQGTGSRRFLTTSSGTHQGTELQVLNSHLGSNTSQFLLQTWRFAYALGSSSDVPNCIKSLRRKTAPSLGIQKTKHKPLCPWESLTLWCPSAATRKLHQIPGFGSTQAATTKGYSQLNPNDCCLESWTAQIHHTFLAGNSSGSESPQAGTLCPCRCPLAEGKCQGVQAGAVLSGRQLLAKLG